MLYRGIPINRLRVPDRGPIGAIHALAGSLPARRSRDPRPPIDDHLNWRLWAEARAAARDLLALDACAFDRALAGDLFPDALRESL